MIVLFYFFVSAAFCRSESERSYCKANGFDSGVLECSTCKLVETYTEDKELTEICRKCCNKFKIEKHPKALFEYDEQRITSELWSFVQNEAPKIKNLQVRTRAGAMCELTLFDGSGNPVDQFSIIEWNTRDVLEFLGDKLNRN
ncbi:uncharacterized protein MONOS_8721 [Monocercomonoides exilis]|uniref:uncharacterized protein n=1 Tax=Monocercomonoides exilis TaxID=2049356 RepID=UPI003559A497|nr:hypothetical protein MONOS_8721 [Monocercomonoides exilis]|eukprot:MONOS_8721.1-p1 / transcript=MONOS_8721.1 / gene=MONOS_8721 / organism=Monocercomonoides_exilis_PA203 / gene_product=unspecified product / transcript_product=unspecified product / location=Mono_scaffold00336:22208-22890(-) / protein_length=142 / sequence_SO=supercontig / SO=protein_coding / is_pseudo=false